MEYGCRVRPSKCFWHIRRTSDGRVRMRGEARPKIVGLASAEAVDDCRMLMAVECSRRGRTRVEDGVVKL